MIYKDELVITTKQLAKMYSLPHGKLYQNFLRHKSLFIENVHYFVISGHEMDELKASYPELKRTNMMYVWTAFGAYLHARFLKGEQAWSGYCQCIYYFFSEEESIQSSLQILHETFNRLKGQEVLKEGALK